MFNKFYKPRGKKLPIEEPVVFADRKESGKILNIGYHDPQKLDSVLDIWKSKVLNDCLQFKEPQETDELYQYLETFLGETMKANWERYKVEYPEELRTLKTFGPNPYNFVNKIHMLATGRDPNSSRIEQQTEALAQLERLVLTDYRYAKSFLKEYYYFASISGNYFTQSIKDKLFQKLPGQLGEEIRQKWHPINDIPENDNIGIRIQHIIKCLKEKYITIHISL